MEHCSFIVRLVLDALQSYNCRRSSAQCVPHCRVQRGSRARPNSGRKGFVQLYFYLVTTWSKGGMRRSRFSLSDPRRPSRFCSSSAFAGARRHAPRAPLAFWCAKLGSVCFDYESYRIALRTAYLGGSAWGDVREIYNSLVYVSNTDKLVSQLRAFATLVIWLFIFVFYLLTMFFWFLVLPCFIKLLLTCVRFYMYIL